MEIGSQQIARPQTTKKRPAGMLPDERLYTVVSCFDVLIVLLESRTYPWKNPRFLSTD